MKYKKENQEYGLHKPPANRFKLFCMRGVPPHMLLPLTSIISLVNGKPLRCFSGEQHGAGASGKLKSKQTQRVACLNWHQSPSCRTHEAPVCLLNISKARKGFIKELKATTWLLTSLHPCPVLYSKH